jgi:hypothetical protein
VFNFTNIYFFGIIKQKIILEITKLLNQIDFIT